MARGQRHSFLPELVSGRRTARRSRVVEGQPRLSRRRNPAHNRLQIIQHIAGRYAQRHNPGCRKPCIPRCVMLRPRAAFVASSVDLDRQSCVAAVKIQNIWSGRVLAAKFQTSRASAQDLPDKHLWQRHCPAQARALRVTPCPALGAVFFNIVQSPLHHALHGPPPQDKLGEE